MGQKQVFLRERSRNLSIALVYHSVFAAASFCAGLLIVTGENLNAGLVTFGALLALVLIWFFIWRIILIIKAKQDIEAVIQTLEATDDISVSDLIGQEKPYSSNWE